MALTPSTMLPLNTLAPDFALPDTDGKVVSLEDFKHHDLLLVMFICNHCPYVKHVRKELSDLAKEYMAKGVGIVAINSNDAIKYPDDSPEKMALEKRQADYLFPYLYDETQEVARAYQAACTPDFYIFNGPRQLVYRGQLDDSRPGNGIPVTGKDIRTALDLLLGKKTLSPDQKPSIGCNIKWKTES